MWQTDEPEWANTAGSMGFILIKWDHEEKFDLRVLTIKGRMSNGKLFKVIGSNFAYDFPKPTFYYSEPIEVPALPDAI